MVIDTQELILIINFSGFNSWKVVEAEGAVVSGTYGHTAVWDPETSYVYVHGGLKTATSSQVVAHLLAYEPFKYKWYC